MHMLLLILCLFGQSFGAITRLYDGILRENQLRSFKAMTIYSQNLESDSDYQNVIYASVPISYVGDLYLNLAFDQPLANPIVYNINSELKFPEQIFSLIPISAGQTQGTVILKKKQLTDVKMFKISFMAYNTRAAGDFKYQIKMTRTLSPIKYNAGLPLSNLVNEIWQKDQQFYKRKIGYAVLEQKYNIDVLFEEELGIDEVARTTGVYFPLGENKEKHPFYVKVGIKYRPQHEVQTSFKICTHQKLSTCQNINFSNPYYGQKQYSAQIPPEQITHNNFVLIEVFFNSLTAATNKATLTVSNSNSTMQYTHALYIAFPLIQLLFIVLVLIY